MRRAALLLCLLAAACANGFKGFISCDRKPKAAYGCCAALSGDLAE